MDARRELWATNPEALHQESIADRKGDETAAFARQLSLDRQMAAASQNYGAARNASGGDGDAINYRGMSGVVTKGTGSANIAPTDLASILQRIGQLKGEQLFYQHHPASALSGTQDQLNQEILALMESAKPMQKAQAMSEKAAGRNLEQNRDAGKTGGGGGMMVSPVRNGQAVRAGDMKYNLFGDMIKSLEEKEKDREANAHSYDPYRAIREAAITAAMKAVNNYRV